MKKNTMKVVIALVGMLFLANPLIVKAEQIAQGSTSLLFSKYEIYGDEYRVMATGRVNAAPYNKVHVLVEVMYTESGAVSSSYSKSVWGFTDMSTSQIVQDVTITKQKEQTIMLSDKTDPSAKYAINVKGNRPDKNAMISGSVKYFTKSN